jgi:hypothetical protein
LQGRTGGRSVVFSSQFYFVAKCLRCAFMPMVVFVQFLVEAFSLLVMNIVVASCWLSSGDVESSVLLLLHARTHT